MGVVVGVAHKIVHTPGVMGMVDPSMKNKLVSLTCSQAVGPTNAVITGCGGEVINVAVPAGTHTIIFTLAKGSGLAIITLKIELGVKLPVAMAEYTTFALKKFNFAAFNTKTIKPVCTLITWICTPTPCGSNVQTNK